MLLIRIIFIFLLCIAGNDLHAQETGPSENDMNSISRQLQKMRFSMNFGTSYGYLPGYAGSMNYFASPGFTYPATNRVSFHGGIISGISTTPLPLSGELNNQSLRFGFTSVFGSVSYQVSPNIIFYGTGIKNLANYGTFSPLAPAAFDEISFGSGIRLGNNITIGASVHFRENNFFRHGNYSPFWGY